MIFDKYLWFLRYKNCSLFKLIFLFTCCLYFDNTTLHYGVFTRYIPQLVSSSCHDIISGGNFPKLLTNSFMRIGPGFALKSIIYPYEDTPRF